MNRSHKIALDPTVTQEAYFRRACGVVHDRDVNAAINLEKLGRATPEVTPVEKKALARRSMRVKPASRKREPTSAHISALER